MYRFRSRWDVIVPPTELWDTFEGLLEQSDPLPWWGAVTATDNRDDEIDLVTRSHFGYRLSFTVHDLERHPKRTMRFASRGDLSGTAELDFGPGRPGRTLLTIDWHVEATPAWMRRTEPLLRPVFVLAHDLVMNSGERQLNRWLAQRG